MLSGPKQSPLLKDMIAYLPDDHELEQMCDTINHQVEQQEKQQRSQSMLRRNRQN